MIRFSIVTPSYNQAAFLPATIQSVLTQSYPELEYIIMDGGSSDGSRAIIEEYASRLAYWQSEKDSGQANAINQGWARTTGDVLAYLNSDDILMPGSLQVVADTFHLHPEIDVIYGDSIYIDGSGEQCGDRPSKPFHPVDVFTTWEDPISQPSTFIRRSVYEKFGGFDESFHFCLDFEYWIRVFGQSKFLYIPECLSAARLHAESKTANIEAQQAKELIRIAEKAIASGLPQQFGFQPEQVRKAVHHRAALHYRWAGQKLPALKTYFLYCKTAYPPVERFYRLARFTAGMLLKG